MVRIGSSKLHPIMFAARNILATGSRFTDSDVNAYIAAVEAADNSALEPGVRNAINQLITDLKTNSLWTPIQTMTLLMGPRTIAGTLINVKDPSTSWTSFNFVSGDYNRTTGLLGNGTTKYLDSGLNSNTVGQNNGALWVQAHTKTTTTGGFYAGAGNSSDTGATSFRESSSSDIAYHSRSSSSNTAAQHSVGLIGLSRSSASDFVSRGGGGDTTNTRASSPTHSANIFAFATSRSGTPTAHCNARLRACCFGQAHSLSAAETCMNTYIAAIVALGL